MIGDKIKERRIALDMTQEDLANRLGYKSKSTINKIELNINDIPLSKVQEFAECLHTTPAYLMGWEDDNHDNDRYYLNPETAKAAKKLYERPELKVLFDASQKATKEDILDVAKILDKFRRNQEGPDEEDVSQDPDDYK